MALYNHVSSKDDLVRGVIALVVDNVQYGSESTDWREQIRACFRALRKACLTHPGIVRLVETAEVLPSSIFRPMEVTLAALAKAGIGPEDSLRVYFLLASFTMGQVSYQTRGPFQGMDLAVASRDGRLPAFTFPVSAAAAQAASLGAWDFDASFELGLSIILAGLDSIAG
jgi:TetR/AcrR family tetracycline transcriptional repressor